MHPISLVSDAEFDDSTDVDGEKHAQSKHHEDFTEGIDEAGFVRRYNFFHLLMGMLCLCLALMNFCTVWRSHSLDTPPTWRTMMRP